MLDRVLNQVDRVRGGFIGEEEEGGGRESRKRGIVE